MTTDPHDRYTEMAAGYALHALEPDDEQTFLAHLPGCADCQAEVAASEAALAELALTLPGTPPSGLRDAVLDSVRTEHLSAPVPTLHDRRRRRATPWLLTAAASVVAVAFAVGNLALRADVRDTRAELAATRAVVACAAPRCTARWLASPDRTRHAVVIDDGSRARLVIDTLPRNNPASDMYVLWRQDTAGRLLAVRGFDITFSRVTTIDLGPVTEPYTGFAVSREPGRTMPTAPTDPILLPA